MRPLLTSLMILCTCLGLAGCAGERETTATGDAEADGLAIARATLEQAGTAARVSTDLVMSVRPLEGDSLQFTINAWCAADGSVRLLVNKVNFDFMDALVLPDGEIVAMLVRDQEVLRGNLTDLVEGKTEVTPALRFLVDVRRITDEIRRGSVPPSAESYRLDGQDEDGLNILHVTHSGGGHERIGISDSPEGYLVRWREFYADNELVGRFDYRRHTRMDGLLRAQRITATRGPEAGQVVVRVRKVDEVPGFRAGTFTLQLPEAWPEIDFDAFLARIQE